MNTCKTCKHWTRNEKGDYHYDSEVMKLIGYCDKSDNGIGKDFFGAHGGGNYDSFYCGEDFGCVNHDEKL